ncbi:T9SS type B sorting domain-containing protein [Nonlabens marinus]|uniref:T9SS type B sorting domain-containing protein n=1 Tax=Nonlabens marinus TaxID=930802 RepID=UPI00059FF7D5|nr:gliding motility-associated C-terminal domain-containing protein [Nonlabens marinus]
MKAKLLLVLLLVCSAFAKAQLESSQWFFGNRAGIDFRSGAPVSAADSAMNTGEGCATLSDADGNLLFYTDGSTIYNRNNEVMLNGSGLKGNSSSTSSAVVVPLPDSDTRFYVFTVDTDDLVYTRAEGMHYSIVDMALDNGKGAVELNSKNTTVLARTSEKLTAVENATDTGYWIITQFEDRFYSYELTASGLHPQPVISQADPFIELVTVPITNVDVAAMRGYIKVNSTGDRLAAAHFSNNITADFDNVTSILEARSIAYAQGGELYLYDFDNATGEVSNPIPLLTRIDEGSYYGIEFSPDGRYLYAEIDYQRASRSSIFVFIGGEIAQFDLTASDVAASKQTIHQDNNLPFRGAMQLGIDGNIYHSRLDQTALSVLSNPNDDSVPVNYSFNGFNLASGTRSFYGLPIFVQSFFQQFEIKATDGCEDQEIGFTLDTTTEDFQVVWNFDDPDSRASNTSNEISPIHIYNTAGTYEVTASIQTLFQQITSSKTIQIFPQVEINPVEPSLIECDLGFATANFDLTVIKNSVSSIADQTVEIYASEQEALEQANAIDTTIPFNSSSTTLFIRVDNENCFKLITVDLIVERCSIEVFNLITPNNDGRNDVLNVTGLRTVYPDYTISIFNRYGRLVWEGGPESEDWDGSSNQINSKKLLPSATYFYTIELNDPTVKNISGYLYLSY